MNTELIRSSIEMKHHRTSALVYGISTLFCLSLLIALALILHENELFACAFMWAVIFLPLTAYHVYKICTLTKDADGYERYTATLDEVHHTWNRKMYLILRVKKPNGGVFRAITSGIFSVSALSTLYYGEFYSRDIYILHNEHTDRTIVLGHD